jgi:hypothetical protein
LLGKVPSGRAADETQHPPPSAGDVAIGATGSTKVFCEIPQNNGAQSLIPTIERHGSVAPCFSTTFADDWIVAATAGAKERIY